MLLCCGRRHPDSVDSGAGLTRCAAASSADDRRRPVDRCLRHVPRIQEERVMDGGRFDGLTKVLTGAAEPTSRRRALGVLASGALCTALGHLGLQDAAAACKKPGSGCKKGNQCCSRNCCKPQGADQGTCLSKTDRCCSFGGFCRNNSFCCAPNSEEPFGTCCPTDFPNCCLPAVKAAGHPGCCQVGFPVCCPPNALEPDGYCCRRGATCCNTGTGCCPVTATIAATQSDLTEAAPGHKARPTVHR
jgi:hypothetical protein